MHHLRTLYTNFIRNNKVTFIVIAYLLVLINSYGQLQTTISSKKLGEVRQRIDLNLNWISTASDIDSNLYNGFESSNYNTAKWMQVNVPHNWDQYEGYRRMLHGNKHGYAWYKKSFLVSQQIGKRYFLFFEGVGSYATVWLNGQKVGYHAGGRTSFTIDVTNQIQFGKENDLAVRADHPANIHDLPWVCGGCSEERGFSEGTQPMGIFRPVHLIITNPIHVIPFGVHVWNDTLVSSKNATLHIETTLNNNGVASVVTVINSLTDHLNRAIAADTNQIKLAKNEQSTLSQQLRNIKNVHLWNVQDPYLYNLKTRVFQNGKLIDEFTTPYGIRSIKWDRGGTNQFLLNGLPVFLNGIAEYEHALGNSHSFSYEQIKTRASQVKQLGFNAFRDAHQPHNLVYQNFWDENGILWWPQLSAHVWYDNPNFKSNFKALLKEWVIERRNNASNILWGLQNESKLPADFAKECVEIIRNLDPTASSQRLITTCNGGEGTDWDVPQNWTGTYGGNINTYHEDIKRQILIGEYGAWRSIDLHSETGFTSEGIASEENMNQLLETKIKLANQSKDSSAGHFLWLYNSHENPGRVQSGEGYRALDQIGPINYKGLFTPWEEPTDAYYLYKSNFASAEKDPMVYIVSHTWPDRWTQPGIKDSIDIYSNCDEVELFNDVSHSSLGKQKRDGIGTHFKWNHVPIHYNVLYALGYRKGKVVAKDIIILNHLPPAPHLSDLQFSSIHDIQADSNWHTLFRINCGGGTYVDHNGNTWLPDLPVTASNRDAHLSYYSSSWNDSFSELPPFFASQRFTKAPILGTMDWPLFQDFRYGRSELKYHFNLPNGDYLVDMYFIEPWLGVGSNCNQEGMRVFDVAFNGEIKLKKLDIWKEVGTNHLLKKQIPVRVENGQLIISFPNTLTGQAIVAAISIATKMVNMPVASTPYYLIKSTLNQEQDLITSNHNNSIHYWLSTGDSVFANTNIKFSALPSTLHGATWLLSQNNNNQFDITTIDTCSVFIAVPTTSVPHPTAELHDFLKDFELTSMQIHITDSLYPTFVIYKKQILPNQRIRYTNTTNSVPLLLFTQPINHMQPAYDLKKSIGYRPSQATQLLAAQKELVYKKESIVFTENKASVQWGINIGAADMYSITLRYANETNETLHGQIQITSADGYIYKTENISFTPSKNGKWNYIQTNTGTVLNAGNYQVQIKSIDAKGVGLSALDIQ